MTKKQKSDIPIGTKALIFSKYYYGVLSKLLEGIEVERYFSILYFLQENNGCTQQHVCNNLAIDKTAMVKVMEYLAMNGYVQRTVNPADRREHFIRLTKKGILRTAEIVKCFDGVDKKIFSSVSREDKENFIRVLLELVNNLKSMPSNDLFFNYKRTQKVSRK